MNNKESSMDNKSPSVPTLLRETRRDDEPPGVIAKLGWRYHHIGIPTNIPRPEEKYLAQFKMYTAGFNTNPFGVEWMRFEPDSPLHELIRTIPHIAFEVDDLDKALEGLDIISPPGSPSEGVRAAMIVHDGAPIELICFHRKENETAKKNHRHLDTSALNC
jgi:hypothetical protein